MKSAIVSFMLLLMVFSAAFAQEKPAAPAPAATTPAAAPAKAKTGGSSEPEVRKKTPEEIALEFLTSGRSQKKLGNYEKAIADFDEVIKLNPKLYEAYIEKSGTKFLMIDFPNAMSGYTDAITMIEEEMKKLKTQSNIKMVLKDTKGARLDEEEANRIKLILAEAYYQRGSVKRFMEDKQGVCDDVKKARELGFLKGNAELDSFCGE